MLVKTFGGEGDKTVSVQFQNHEGTVFIVVEGETVGGLTFDENDRGVVAISLNYNDPFDGEWVKVNPITFTPEVEDD